MKPRDLTDILVGVDEFDHERSVFEGVKCLDWRLAPPDGCGDAIFLVFAQA